jgi:hypothetical protein
MTHIAGVTRQIDLGQISDVSQIILTSSAAGERGILFRDVSMMDFLTNADHWRKRAEQTRALAANAVKDQGRLLKVAEEYDRLAAHAEQRRMAAVPVRSYAPASPGE